MNKDIRTDKKAKELWVSYYFYVPDTPDNFTDPLLQPYITQFYGSNKKSGQIEVIMHLNFLLLFTTANFLLEERSQLIKRT